MLCDMHLGIQPRDVGEAVNDNILVCGSLKSQNLLLSSIIEKNSISITHIISILWEPRACYMFIEITKEGMQEISLFPQVPIVKLNSVAMRKCPSWESAQPQANVLEYVMIGSRRLCYTWCILIYNSTIQQFEHKCRASPLSG